MKSRDVWPAPVPPPDPPEPPPPDGASFSITSTVKESVADPPSPSLTVRVAV